MSREPAERLKRVTAVYADAKPCFDFAREVTLGQLAEQLCVLGENHGGLPLVVGVRVAIEATA
ncbi:MAG: hypothetical protein ACJ8AH_02950 [Stellaceae bacterium]|jgi:hypothetical protein